MEAPISSFPSLDRSDLPEGASKVLAALKRLKAGSNSETKKTFLADIYIVRRNKSASSRTSSRRRKKKLKNLHLSREQLQSPIATWPRPATTTAFGSERLSDLSNDRAFRNVFCKLVTLEMFHVLSAQYFNGIEFTVTPLSSSCEDAVSIFE